MPLYPSLLRPVLFHGDPERMHDRAIQTAAFCSKHPGILSAVRRFLPACHPVLGAEAAGMRFPTPLGLAAGFDKNGKAIPFWAALGFGHVEIGSVSADPSAGNPKPRLFRIPEDRGIVVHYGLPNHGAEAVAAALAGVTPPVPLGINLVNTNRGPSASPESTDAIIRDYVHSFRLLQPHASYIALNLSCPNTPDGRGFLNDSCRLAGLLEAIASLRPVKPVFLKVAPFRDTAQIESFLSTVEDAGFVSGFSTNLPPGKPAGLTADPARLSTMPGAVSGVPCRARALEMVGELYRRMDRRRYWIIGSGGVFSAADAYAFLRRGASLIQLATALVFQGPAVVHRIGEELAGMLRRDGFKSAAEAVGSGSSVGPGSVLRSGF